MRLLSLAFVIIMITIVAMTGCSKKEDKAPSIQPSKQITSIEAVVKVPDNIKGKWKAVNISVYDKQKAKETTYTIGIGSTFALPNTDLSIKVETFFPNFVMKGINLTSETNDLKILLPRSKFIKDLKKLIKVGSMPCIQTWRADFRNLDFT